MLRQLHIKNVALIEECEISFGNGLHILSGETGAGKSMVIDALNFALGERMGKDFLRKDAKIALVEAIFTVKEKKFWETLEERGIENEEEDTLLLTRTMNEAGKTVARVNGYTVTAGSLKEICEGLIDIHGQHQHQSLLNANRHITLLDRFCGKELEEYLKEYATFYGASKKIEKDLLFLKEAEVDAAERVDFLSFQCNEIIEANLQVGEEESLLERKKILVNSEKLLRLCQESSMLLYDGRDGEGAAIDQLAMALEKLSELSAIDGIMEPIYETINGAYIQLMESVRDVKRYEETIEVEPEALEQVEERLQIIYRLKRKYGKDISAVLAYLEEKKQELGKYENREEIILALEKSLEQNRKKANVLAGNITALRQEKAVFLEKEIEKQLHDLEMKQGKFQVLLEKREVLTASGQDKVEFLISANQGEECKPLAKIASGGEMSRVMLALKTVLAQVDTIETFVFDEIDTGVSGRTAQKVGEKMAVLGKSHQLICITHLPQIAAKADHHYLIEKKVVAEKTMTSVETLEDDQSILEVARLMGGAAVTEATLAAAKELWADGR